MKNSKIFLFAVAVFVLASCADVATIKCTVAGAPSSQMVVKQLEVNTFSVLDTIKTDSKGSFTYKVKVAKGQPEFVYLFRGETQLAALLLEKGENAVVIADTLGNYSVKGSEGSEKLQQVNKTFMDFVSKMDSTEDPAELTRYYVEHYREAVRYCMSNPYSLTVIPVLYERVNNLSVFNQTNDAIHFRSAADSLITVYPESRYVKALSKEADRRMQVMDLRARLKATEAMSYPDITLPDMNGQKVSLSSVEAKVILLHFWNAADATHKMLNMEALLPVYKEFHSRGFEIYSVCVDADKSEWAAVVKAQGLPWINVNDGYGSLSPALQAYNVSVIPSSFILTESGVSAPTIDGAAGLRKELVKVLK